MNTTEVKVTHCIKSFEDLFKMAKKQFVEYEKLEGIENWNKYDFSIDCAEDQLKFKDMIQIRFIEELTEATQAIDEKEHFCEELADSLNFFLSAYIMLGVDLNKFQNPNLYLNNYSMVRKLNYTECCLLFFPVVDRVGSLCNLLKNRPWTQSNYLVSLLDFNQRLEILWETYWRTLGFIGLNDNKIFELFERKFKVNQWRIKTGY